jgi:hypothetical protein
MLNAQDGLIYWLDGNAPDEGGAQMWMREAIHDALPRKLSLWGIAV